MRSIKREMTDLKPWVTELMEIWPTYIKDNTKIEPATHKRLKELMIIVSHVYLELSKEFEKPPTQELIFNDYVDDFISLRNLWRVQDFTDDVGVTWLSNMLLEIERMEAYPGN